MSFTTPIYPGVNLDANDGPQMDTVAIIFIVFTFITLVLRYYSRLATNVSIELDDWLIVVAAVRLHNNKSIQYTERWQPWYRSFAGVTLWQWLSRLSTIIMVSTSAKLMLIIWKSSTKAYTASRLSILLLLPLVNCRFWRYTGVSFE